MIRVVAFDLDDTLWHVEPVIIKAEKTVSKWLRQQVEGYDMAIEEMRQIRNQLITQDPTLGHRLTELRRQVLHEAIRRTGHPNAGTTAEQAMEIFLAARNDVSFFDGALETIAHIAPSYTLGAITNGNADIHRLGLGNHFSFAFSAEQVGAPKPEPHLFETALAHTNVAPSEMVYVGDDPIKDVDAANRLGIRTIWMKSTARPKPGDTTPDQTITDIRDLPKALTNLTD